MASGWLTGLALFAGFSLRPLAGWACAGLSLQPLRSRQLSRMERAAKIPVIEELDGQTRCKHWYSPLDIIAIKMPCCGKYFSCFECHRENTDHAAKVWRRSQFASEFAVLCGSCKIELTVEQYLGSGSTCPRCQAAFNPRCSAHYHLYFEQ